MAPNEVVTLLGAGAMVLAGWTVLLPRHWRGAARQDERTLSGWLPFSHPFRRGLMRSTPLMVFAFTCLYIPVALVFPVRGITGHAPTGIALWLLGGLVLLGVGLAVVAWPMVILFNWPKFVVAPVYRSDPGALASWRRACEIREAIKEGPSQP